MSQIRLCNGPLCLISSPRLGPNWATNEADFMTLFHLVCNLGHCWPPWVPDIGGLSLMAWDSEPIESVSLVQLACTACTAVQSPHWVLCQTYLTVGNPWWLCGVESAQSGLCQAGMSPARMGHTGSQSHCHTVIWWCGVTVWQCHTVTLSCSSNVIPTRWGLSVNTGHRPWSQCPYILCDTENGLR